MNEAWKDVVEYEGIYQISTKGNFRRNPDNPRKAAYPKYINRLGYEYVSISNNCKKANKTIHQLVAAAFIPNFKYGMHINHKDGNKVNNDLANLELTNSVHNNTHAHTLPTTSKPGLSKYHNVTRLIDKRHKNPKIVYIAGVKIASKRYHIGNFADEIEAAKAVDSYLDKIGDTLRLRNFP
jgi:hypothetical protein